ncbi:ankyrin repeat domain-containing protein [Maribacter sp. 2307ULW6-5]|uniref:ankyrin repeat domain-containing protein n=1 Tax=Maribacter sp. 2307ULW6-5 TaxID=3386275 RepID=UPI0039BCBF87
MTLQEAIRAKDFEKAVNIVQTESDPFEGLRDYHVTGIYDSLLRERAFDVIEALVESGAIEMDIYEHDSFNKTIFMSLVKNLGTDAESLSFLDSFVPRVQNLNDELEGKSFLGLALEHETPIEVVRAMVHHGCDVNIIDRSEGNLVHAIVKKYTRKYDLGLAYLELMYEQGVDLEKANVAKETPLHIAVREHRMEYIKWLLENGADPNVQDAKGVSPFYHAVANAIDLEKYKLMREYATPEFDQRTTAGEALLFQTIKMGCGPELLQLLLEDGADLYATSTDRGQPVTAMDALVDTGPELLKVVIAASGFEVNHQDDAGNTLLHKICGRFTMNEDKRAKEVYRNVKMLLEAGADPSMTNANEETAMMIASTDNLKAKTVALLVAGK